MKLYFLRHGIADWPDWQEADDKRPLTADGIARMRAEAKALKKLGLELDVILSSPLPRAKQTAELVADKLGYEVKVSKALAPGFDISKLAALLKENAKAESVMIVGHEPDFSTAVAALTGGKVVLKKGGLVRVDLASPETLEGQLVWLLAPKILAGE